MEAYSQIHLEEVPLATRTSEEHGDDIESQALYGHHRPWSPSKQGQRPNNGERISYEFLEDDEDD